METFGRYQVLRRLAVGGMAELHLARHRAPGGQERLVVLKRILPHLAEHQDFVAMFLDEARIASRLDHPNLVRILDVGEHQGTCFLAMEYVYGEDLRQVWLRAQAAGQPLPQSLACRVLIEACAGLDHAHKQVDARGRPLGIIHRDVSPQNLLVAHAGAVKVGDFGIAKAADTAAVTRSGVLKGKYAYMSPEQAQGQPLDHRTDLFALGVVGWELLTGRRLFRRETDLETLAAVSACEVPPPWTVEPRVPEDLGEVVMRALARDRTRRHADLRALGEALEGWLDGHRLPSSRGHLAAYLRRLYPEAPERPPEEAPAAAPLTGADTRPWPPPGRRGLLAAVVVAAAALGVAAALLLGR